MTAISSLLGVALPILQAPMAGSQDAALAIAVSEAGGLGALPCAMLSPDAIRAEVGRIRSATARPFNLNFFCHEPRALETALESAWRAALAPYYAELGVDATQLAPAASRAPFDEGLAELVEGIRPPVVSFHFGLPSADLLARVKATGAKILSSATTLDEARCLEARGVDAVIAQGLEAGGHRGHFLSIDLTEQLGTVALVSQLARALGVPVIAAGGIADARGVAAAFALGAAGVQVGSAYLSCPEATTSAVHRAALRSEQARHTALTNVFTGRPARGIVNRFIREQGPLRAALPAFPHTNAVVAPLRAAAERLGSGDFSPLWAGQNLIDQALGAAALTQALALGAPRSA